MTFLFDGYNYVVRLNRGERLSEALNDFMADVELEGAAVSGIGAALEVELGFYDLEAQEYKWQVITRPLEIVSLLGTIALDEQNNPIFHLHGSLSDEQYQVMGGHVKDLVVGGTCELFIHRTFKPLHRTHDADTGLNLLHLDNERP